MTREEFKARVYKAFDSIPTLEDVVEKCWQLHLEASDNWISVEDDLPEKDNEFEDYSKLVLVANGKCSWWQGMYNYGGEEWLTHDLWPIEDATHWMEIQPPRKEEK